MMIEVPYYDSRPKKEMYIMPNFVYNNNITVVVKTNVLSICHLEVLYIFYNSLLKRNKESSETRCIGTQSLQCALLEGKHTKTTHFM